MSHDPQSWLASLPAISDESVVEILDFLQAFIVAFESFYGGQIHRYYDQRSRHNLIQPAPKTLQEDLPF